MSPAFDKGVAGEDFFQPCRRRSVEAEELDVMTGISFVNGHNIGRVEVKSCQPLFLLFGRPMGFDRSDVVKSLRGFGFERAWSIHRGETSGAHELRGFIDARAN